MKKFHFKAISFILMFAICICALPVAAANLESEISDVSNSLDAATCDSIPEPEITPNPDYVQEDITEIVDRREENVKHFLLEDGSVTAIIYSYAVHRKDQDGVWQDIDNRLYKDDSGNYSTIDNRVSFSSSNSNNLLLSLHEEEYTVSMGPISSNAAIKSNQISVENHLSREEQLTRKSDNLETSKKIEQVSKIDNKTDLLYKNISNGIDLKYTLQSNEIKEYIVVNAAQSEYVYKFSLRLGGLEARLTNNESIVLFDSVTKEDKYYIPAPYMFDASGSTSTDVHYKLEKISAGNYLLTITADSDWINDQTRVFPVTIDPTLEQKVSFDTYIDAGNPNANYGDDNDLQISSSKIAFIKARTSSIPSGSEVSYATLSVACYFSSGITSGTLSLGAYQVVESWNEFTLTWSSANQYTNKGISSTKLSSRTLNGDAGAYADSPQWKTFIITSAAASWFNGSNNYGIALKRESGTIGSLSIYSAESGLTYRPYMTISYKEPIITEGVYRLKNTFNNYYLTTSGVTYKSGAPIVQYEDKGSNDLTQLFKISFIRDCGNDRHYDIRPMTNSALGLNAPLITSDTHKVTADAMATTDGWYDIPQTQKWMIQTNASGGYVNYSMRFRITEGI